MQKVVITDDLNYINNPATDFIGYDSFEGEGKISAFQETASDEYVLAAAERGRETGPDVYSLPKSQV